MEIYDIHLKDVVVINMVFKINRESHVLIGSELARMQKSIKDKFDETEQLEKLFRAHWWVFIFDLLLVLKCNSRTPQHGVENLSSVKLHARLTEFREDLQKKVDSMKNPQAYHTNKDLPRFVIKPTVFRGERVCIKNENSFSVTSIQNGWKVLIAIGWPETRKGGHV